MTMTMEEFFAEAKRLRCRMHLGPEDQRAAFDLKDAEIERLRAALRWQEARDGRIGTHGPGCHTWGHCDPGTGGTINTESTPEAFGSNDELGQMVKAWYCVYSSGQEFVSLVEYPMNDPNVRECWRLFSMAERDDAVAVERERCAIIADHVAKICLHPDEIAEAIRTGLIPELGPITEG